MSKYCNDPNGVTSSNVVNCPNIVNDPNIVNSSNVVNCPYKWVECSKLSNCCDKEKKEKQTKKHHTFGTIPKSTISI